MLKVTNVTPFLLDLKEYGVLPSATSAVVHDPQSLWSCELPKVLKEAEEKKLVFITLVAQCATSHFRMSSGEKRVDISDGMYRPPSLASFEVTKNPRKIFWCGGVGDILAMLCFLTEKEMQNVEEIYFCTPYTMNIIGPLLPYCFPNFKQCCDLTENRPPIGYPHNLIDAAIRTPHFLHPVNDFFCLTDYSWMDNWDRDVFLGPRTYRPPSITKLGLPSVSSFSLPRRFVVINPCSTTRGKNKNSDRDLVEADWDALVGSLERSNVHGVVLNWGEEKVPEHSSLIDLTNKTNVIQAVEITKRAIGFAGCASWVSVLASKIFPSNKLVVKSAHLRRLAVFSHFYYSPLVGSDFLVQKFSLQNHRWQ